MAARARVVLPDGTSRSVQINVGWLVYEFKNEMLPQGSSPDNFGVTSNNATLEDWDSLPVPRPGQELVLIITARVHETPPLASAETPGNELAAEPQAVAPEEQAPFPDDAPPDVPPPPVVQALCKYDYRPASGADGEGHLLFKKGEIVEVVEKGDEGWWVVKRASTSEEGFAPSSYLQELPSTFLPPSPRLPTPALAPTPNNTPVVVHQSMQIKPATLVTPFVTPAPAPASIAAIQQPASVWTPRTAATGSPPSVTSPTVTVTPTPTLQLPSSNGSNGATSVSNALPSPRSGGMKLGYGSHRAMSSTPPPSPFEASAPALAPAPAPAPLAHTPAPAAKSEAKKANARGGMRMAGTGAQSQDDEAEFEQFLNEMAEAPERIKAREDAERQKDWEDTQRYLAQQKEAREKTSGSGSGGASTLAVPKPSASVRGGSTITRTPSGPASQSQSSTIITTSGDDDVGDGSSVRAAVRRDELLIVLPGGGLSTYHWMAGETLTQLRDTLIKRGALGAGALAHHFAFRAPGTVGITLDENVPISSFSFLAASTRRGIVPTILLANKQSEESRREKTVSREIGSVLGRPVVVSHEQDEVAAFRQRASRLREGCKSNLPAAMRRTGTPGLGKKLLVRVHLEQVVKLIPLEPANETAAAFVTRIHGKHMRGSTKPAEAYCLRVAGGDLVPGEMPIEETPYVASCVAKNTPPEFSLAPAPEEDDPLEDFLPPNTDFEHREISLAAHAARPAAMQVLSIWDIERPFRFKLMGAENVGLRAGGSDEAEYYVQATVHHGEEALSSTITSITAPGVSSNPKWNSWINLDLQIANLPLAARLSLTLLARRRGAAAKDLAEEAVGWVNVQLFDWRRELRQGVMSLNLWPDERANPIGTTQPSPASANPPVLFVSFDVFALPLVYPAAASAVKDDSLNKSAQAQEVVAWIEQIASKDPLFELDTKSRKALWVARKYCILVPNSLPKLLTSVPYADRNSVVEMHALIARWPLLQPSEALQLLDAEFPDPVVRAYAVACLEGLPDEKLIDFLLQLVQVLKYEPNHDSPLARFVLRRALASPRIGKAYFWYLKAELHVPEISERCAVLLEAYLRGSGNLRAELKKQDDVLRKLVIAAMAVKAEKDHEKRKSVAQEELRKQQLPGEFAMPFDKTIECRSLLLDKCRVMDSKKLPLWVVFQNADRSAPAVPLIFKCGDDLRQDMLTLQMLGLMERVWQAAGLDFLLRPYACISTGLDVGLIEVVPNAETLASITKSYGGAKAVFDEKPLQQWLASHNPGPEAYAKAVETFIYSCAGYCVATYVLGIGDRHNDNIMLTRQGRLFHIDFGHFLGHFKEKFGIKRERAPFVFTPHMAYVMGGKDSDNYKRFVELACRAYNVLRRHASTFINLFAMMLSTGIPELRSINDIEYLREAFSLDLTDEKASEKYKLLITESLNTRTTQMMHAIHIAVHS